MSFECPTLNATDSTNNVFQPKCGTEIFKTFRRQFDLENDEYLEYMNKINDPTLKYVSVYLVQYYKDGYKYFGKSTKPYRSGACRYLIKWLHEKRDLFTYGKMCQKKLNLWNDKIVKLWEMLLKNSKYFDNEQKPWCDNPLLSFETTFPPYVSMHKCAEIISKEPCSKVLDCPQVPTECNCSVKEIPVNSLETAPLPETDHPPDTDRTKNLAVTSGFTAVGTLGTLFFLYRFTPMMSWFRRPGMNNVGTDLYMNPGGAESFISMQQGNGSNNLFYQP